jgi:hypothetical protein
LNAALRNLRTPLSFACPVEFRIVPNSAAGSSLKY